MTGEEALKKAIIIVSYFEAHFAKSKEAREESVNIIEALERLEPCEDAISRQEMLNGLANIAKAKARSDAQKALMGRVMFFTEHLPSVSSLSRRKNEVQE